MDKNISIHNEKIKDLEIRFGDDEIKDILGNIQQCLKTGRLYQSQNVEAFENLFAKYHGVKYGVAVSSGCAAIEIPMRILDIRNKEVIIPVNTFIATALGVVNAGGKVKLADTAKGKLTPGLKEIQKQVTDKTVGVILVHIGGMIQEDIEEIRKWCCLKGFFLFEDASHAHGSRYGDKYAGGFGVAAGFSLFATKIITCGEGGIILTNDKKIAERAKRIRNYGKSSDWITENNELGGNYRMSEITAAIALSQTNKLDEIVRKRKKLAELYNRLISSWREELGVKTIYNEQISGWYKMIVVLPLNVEIEQVQQFLEQRGIKLPGKVYQYPLHKQPIAKQLKLEGYYPNAEDICKRHIALPIYPSLEESNVYKIVDCLKQSILESKKHGKNKIVRS